METAPGVEDEASGADEVSETDEVSVTDEVSETDEVGEVELRETDEVSEVELSETDTLAETDELVEEEIEALEKELYESNLAPHTRLLMTPGLDKANFRLHDGRAPGT
jgi:SMC interacting uncharacterized protein involved in chromosome segregation